MSAHGRPAPRALLPTPAAWAVALLAALTTFATLASWDGLSDNASAFLVPLFWLSLGVALLGLALRSLLSGLTRGTARHRAALVVVPVVQAAAVGLWLVQRWAPEAPYGGWVPTPTALGAARDVLAASVAASQEWGAPVPSHVTEFAPLLLLAGAVVVLLVDWLATTLHRVPLAGLPLLAAFTVPVSILSGVPWLSFAAAAFGFAMLLAADQALRLSHWGRSLAGTAPAGASAGEVHDSAPREVRLGTVWPAASRLGLLGVGIAVFAPLVMPSGGGLLSGFGAGSGAGDGVSVTNPMVDIRRDLTRGEDVPQVLIATDDPDPGYLRFTVLDQFDGDAWRPGKRDIPAENQADGVLPAPPGLRPDTPREQYSTRIEVFDTLTSTWLPNNYPTQELAVEGDWRYDPRTLDVVSADDGLRAGGQVYESISLKVRPDTAALVRAGAPPQPMATEMTALPDDFPAWVGDLAEEVTAGARSDFERAVLLQTWFRSTGGFEYSLDRADGTSTEQLAAFLQEDGKDSRRGYCEQFASAMAMMARSLGLPARIAVGFLRPEPVGEQLADGRRTWVYSSYDLHAWPEIYFAGAGWLRFEPTPQSRAAEVPAYTQGRVPSPIDDLTPTQSAAPDDLANRQPNAAPQEEIPTVTSTADQGLPSWWWWPPVALAGLLVLAAPRTARVWLRRRRAASPTTAEAAWAELRATAIDLGLRWDDAATLRRGARTLLPALTGPIPGRRAAPGSTPAADTDAIHALEQLVLLVERSRYAPAGLPPSRRDEAWQLARTVGDALHAAASPGARRRARWLPASLWRRRGVSGRVPGHRRRTDAVTTSPKPEAPVRELDRV